jgi:hypothetical protein
MPVNKRLLWAKGDFTLRETEFEPKREQIEHGQKVLDKAIERCLPKKKLKV